MIVAISSLITLIGLWCVLRKYFTAGTIIPTLLLLALGTNFFLMSVYSGAIQASILLALMVLVVWMSQRWVEKPAWFESIVMGFAMGTLIFVKPAGFASILVFLFWGAYNKETFRVKWKLFFEHSDQVITILILFLGGLFIRLFNPQMFEGTWFCDYVQHKRAVYLLSPWMWQVLFSIKNGWIIYTPLVLFAIPGFYILAERNKRIFYATFLFSLTYLFLLASTPEATSPDNFSQARMTEIFAVLFIPIAYFINWISEGGWTRKIFFILLLTVFVVLNLFQTWQYRTKILNPWFTTPEYYKAVFLKTHADGKTRSLQEFSNMDMSSYLSNESEFNISTKMFFDFENGPGGFEPHIQNSIAFSGKQALRLDTSLQYTPGGGLSFRELPGTFPLGVRLSAMVYSGQDFSDDPASIIITLKHKDQFYRYKTVLLQDLNAVKGKWNYIKLDYVIPKQYDLNDEVNSYIRYSGNKAIFVDDLKLELFEQK